MRASRPLDLARRSAGWPPGAIGWFQGFLGVGLLEFKIRLPDFEETQSDSKRAGRSLAFWRALQSSSESPWLSAVLELSSRGYPKNSNAEFGPLGSHELGEALSFYPSLFQQPQSVEPLAVHEGPVVLNGYQTAGSVG